MLYILQWLVDNGQKHGTQTDQKQQKTRNLHGKNKKNYKMNVNYEKSVTMPITNPLTATNSEHQWFKNVCIPGLFC
jgi:hypothetical protein